MRLFSTAQKAQAPSELDIIKQEKWFYEFPLPDGSRTESYLPENVRPVHHTREKALREYLAAAKGKFSSALDVSCHEGFYSVVMAEYFDKVTGIDKNPVSLEKAARMAKFLGRPKIRFENTSVEDWDEKQSADFVLCFGLLYHVENPIQIFRKLATLTRQAICIETQVLPFEMSGPVEDGSYMWQRDLQGTFGLCKDYSHSTEGGLTDLALIPSKDAVEFLLKEFGFKTVHFYQPVPEDYEQFVRRSRIIVYAEKQPLLDSAT